MYKKTTKQACDKLCALSGLVLVLLLSTMHFANAQVTNGLIAQYAFDDATANDSIGTNHGIINGATPTNDRFGNPNHAFHFDNQDITVNAMNLGSLSEVTVSVWLKPDSIPAAWTNNNTLFTIGGYWTLYLNRFTSKKLLAVFDANSNNNSSSDETDSIAYNKWTFLVATNDGFTTKVYVNGVLEGAYPEIFQWGNNSKMYLGKHISSPTQSYYGNLDDLRIYGRALDSLEIDTLYKLPNPVVPTSIATKQLSILSSPYPNPTLGMVNVPIEGDYREVIVRVKTTEGKLVQNKRFSSSELVSFNLEGMPGIYLIDVYTDGHYLGTSKVMKQ
jgi:hypothetical protein